MFWTLLVSVVLGGMAFVAYFGVQPRPVQKIKLSHFENTVVVANSILISLRPELVERPFLIWGMDGENADQRQVFKDFITVASEPKVAYSLIVIDQSLENLHPEIKTWPGERIDTKGEIGRLIASLKSFQEKHARVLIVMPTGYATSFLENSPASQIAAQQIPTTNVLFSDFPRSREQEDQMPIRCDVGGHDQTGMAELGCKVLTTARLHYRKKFDKGGLTGLLNQISQNDFLFLLTREP